MFLKHIISTSLLLFNVTLAQAAALECPPLDPIGMRRIDEQAQQILKTCILHEPNTKTIHYDDTIQQYSAERVVLHHTILEGVFNEKACSEQQAIAILTGGLPGSGKTTFLKNNLKNFSNYLMIDADTIREKLPEYKGWNASNTHEEVKHIVTHLIHRIGTPCNIDLVYDGTMSTAQNYIDLIHRLEQQGYVVYLVYARNPLEVSILRALQRYQHSGRYVPEEYIRFVSEHIDKSFNKVKPYVSGYVVFDGDTNKIVEMNGDIANALNIQRPQDVLLLHHP